MACVARQPRRQTEERLPVTEGDMTAASPVQRVRTGIHALSSRLRRKGKEGKDRLSSCAVRLRNLIARIGARVEHLT